MIFCNLPSAEGNSVVRSVGLERLAGEGLTVAVASGVIAGGMPGISVGRYERLTRGGDDKNECVGTSGMVV
jgi:hypothetical protein